jgi:hypothetical protein
MKTHPNGSFKLILLILTLSGWSCKSVQPVSFPQTPLEPSAERSYQPLLGSHAKLIEALNNTYLHSIQGTARVQFSAPGLSERIVTEFTSSRKQMYLELRNTLGIVGAEVLSGADSVTILNKMDKLALRLSVDEYNQREDIRLRLPLNFLSIFNPQVDSTNLVQLLENEEYYKVLLKDGHHLVVNKQDYLPVTMVIADTTADRFTTFMYDGFEEIQGMRLPRRIQAYTTDRKSRIRIEVSRLEINPKDTIFALTVPPGIPIYR